MRRLLTLQLWLFLALFALPAQAGPLLLPQEDRADVFKLELQRIHSKMEQGQWARAEGQLKAILGSHARQPYVVEHLGEIELILKRCLFWPDHEDVDLDARFQGKLLAYDKRRGTLKLRYTKPGQLDLQTGTRAGIRPFAVSFSGPYSIELKGEELAYVAVCLDTDSAITVQFGHEPTEASSGFGPDKNMKIERWVEIKTIRVDRHGKQREDTERKTFTTRGEGATPDLKVEVDALRVSARFDGKLIATVRKARDFFGGFGIHPSIPHSDEIEIQGDASVWIQSERDRLAIGPMNEFNRTWKLADHVPAWLIEASEAPVLSVSPSIRGHVSPAPEPLSENDIRDIQVSAAKELYSGHPERCLERIADGIRRGAPAGALQMLSSTANKALHGPSWTSKHTFESTNYIVSSDISRSVSRKVAQVLEESLKHVSSRMGYSPDTRNRKFIVYVFSGERSYDLFVRDVFGARMENTLGMYSGALKQLLIRHAESQDDYLNTTRHEGFHQYLDAFPIEQPIWLNEGLAEYFAAARSNGAAWHDGALEVGRLSVLRQLGTLDGGLAQQLLPLEKFVTLRSQEFMANAQVGYAQAWAFVHFLRHSSVQNKDSFKRLIRELMAGRSTEDAVRSAFRGVDWKRLDAEFQRHIEGL